ncbi:hypothetical protein LQ327_18325 [Actinomycetospora endophytica]|uniref:Uncharacterized protein n=1 Tax=Actinomycetospora endophytica TaxID=2291215 RepID=A0ABS8PBF7_9PSEU|nr:hypothetical protein [Actinomycetospora endophytica]MCD2195328.1 hypothetical protein [Actinomycetospora endophytica]
MEARVQRVLIWSGPLMVVLWVGAFIGIAGWFPPSPPSSSAPQILDLYASHPNAIKFGMVVSMAASALLVPWAVAISGQLRRIDGAKALADVQMVSCALLSLEFITPIGVWMAAAFRYDGRAPDVTEALHDVGWILFMTVIWSLWIQLVAIGVAVLIDRRTPTVLPRWIGYLNLWVAVLIIPAGLVLYFKNGPFAWNGLIGLYLPLTAFVIWVFSMTLTVHRNLGRQIAEADEGSEPAWTRSSTTSSSERVTTG